MSWNYRIVKTKNAEEQLEYGIHEVYYNDEGNVKSYTENSLIPVCDSVEDLKYEIDLMLKAFENKVIENERT